MKAYDIILKPVLTEKTYTMISEKRYAFNVHLDATKTDVKRAVQEIFGVEVKKVNILNKKGKWKRRGRTEGYTPKTRKAYVLLKETSKPIEYFEGLM